MKKIFTVIVLLTLLGGVKTTKAQFEYIGGGVALATGAKYNYNGFDYYSKSFGFDLRAVYDYSKKIQVVPDLKFYLPYKNYNYVNGEAKTTAFAFNLNVHYILNPKPRTNYRLYLLGGAHIGMWKIKDEHYSDVLNEQYDINEFKFFPGANAGAGMQFELNANFLFFAEAKYVVAKTNQLVFTPGFLIVL